MNRQQISALLVLKELGISHGMSSFDDRLSVQKSVYLAQAMGVKLGHHFNWYLRGPYSPSLTRDVFDAVEGYDPGTVLGRWKLDVETAQRLGRLRPHLEPPSGCRLARAHWLELLASVHFLLDRHQVDSREPSALRERLAKFEKHFEESEILEALRRLDHLDLLSGTRH